MNNRRTQWQRRGKTSLTIFTSHFIARVRKGCVGFYCERELEIEHNWNILTPLLWPSRCVFLVLLMLNRRPRGSLWCVMAFFIASYQHLLWTSAHQGPRPLQPGVAFPITSHSTGTRTLWPKLNCQLPLPLPTASSAVLTALYNCSTPTRSLTRSLKSNL